MGLLLNAAGVYFIATASFAAARFAPHNPAHCCGFAAVGALG
jgi:hypothetical protein